MPRKRSKARMAKNPTPMQVLIPPALRTFVRERVEEGSFQGPAHLVKHLLEEERRRVEYERRRLVRMIEDGMNSGPPMVADERFWAKLRQDVAEQVGRRRKAG